MVRRANPRLPIGRRPRLGRGAARTSRRGTGPCSRSARRSTGRRMAGGQGGRDRLDRLRVPPMGRSGATPTASRRRATDVAPIRREPGHGQPARPPATITATAASAASDSRSTVGTATETRWSAGTDGSFERRPRWRAWSIRGARWAPPRARRRRWRFARAGRSCRLPPPGRRGYRRRSPRAGPWWRDGVGT